MFTFRDAGQPSRAPSAARHISRAILLAGLALPFVPFAQNGFASDAPPAMAEPAPPGQGLGLEMTDAMAGMHYGLNRRDLMLYRRVFAAIDESDWATVDATLPYIEDRRLIGHVRAARFLMPGVETQFADLRAWLDVYGDLPEADDIYQLAEAKKPKDTYLPRPHVGQPSNNDANMVGDDMGSTEPRTAAGEHAFSRFYASDDKGALADATKAIGTLGDKATRSHWIAGLAAWRMGDLKEAGKHFTTLAVSRSASGWLQAAGAYWAGRVDERNGGGAQAAKWFGSASRYPTTFYGMLAQRKLGLDIAQEISGASLTAGHLDALADTPAGYRAVALLELGRRDLASQELEKIGAAGNPKLEEAVIVTTAAGHLNDFSSTLAQRVARPAEATATYYPIPRWQPRSGFHVDPALLFAVARQESRFHPDAVNPSGAAGLMQLMPGTASQMAHGRPGSLLDPSTNLELGQRLISTLMQDPNVGENLMLLAVAYNGGSGTPARLQKLLDHDDPLMAVESISKTETRTFIKNVLANYWIYRARLGGDTSSLTELADGRWPLYRWDAADVGN
jgi:soluble lytic murein transglycosylase-like protein